MENRTILISGASGNIGSEVIRGLKEIQSTHQIVAADYNPERAKEKLDQFSGLEYRTLDFAHPGHFDDALKGVDVVFLLRPPSLADVDRYFVPFVEAMKRNGIFKVVFLSVQGAEKQSFIPHHKLEKLLVEQEMEYVFLRPSYFMQNLTTTLLPDILADNRIFIPAGNLKFNWIDARDIGLVGAHVLNDFDPYAGQALEVTGSDFCGFDEAASLLSEQLQRKISYESPSLFAFYRTKRKQGYARMMIMVMIMLHYLPRFGSNRPQLTHVVEDITGKRPITLKEFMEREAALWETKN